MPNAHSNMLRTEADAKAEQEIKDTWMGRAPHVAARLATFDPADWLVESRHGTDLMECKDRSRWSSDWMAEHGYKIGTEKVDDLIDLAAVMGIRPWVLFRTAEEVILLDPFIVREEAPIDPSWKRERGAGRRKDLPEPAYIVHSHLWAAWVPRDRLLLCLPEEPTAEQVEARARAAERIAEGVAAWRRSR